MANRAADHELELLQSISQRNGGIRQRDLARIIGLSLGMTNAILRRLAQKGWLTIRKVNNRNIQYAVSPEGMEEIARRSYRYFRRTIKNVVYYKEAIDAVVADAQSRGFRRLALVGRSDLDFIVEHLCAKRGVAYTQRVATDGPVHDDQEFLLFSEKTGASHGADGGAADLRDLFVRREPTGAHGRRL